MSSDLVISIAAKTVLLNQGGPRFTGRSRIKGCYALILGVKMSIPARSAVQRIGSLDPISDGRAETANPQTMHKRILRVGMRRTFKERK